MQIDFEVKLTHSEEEQVFKALNLWAINNWDPTQVFFNLQTSTTLFSVSHSNSYSDFDTFCTESIFYGYYQP